MSNYSTRCDYNVRPVNAQFTVQLYLQAGLAFLRSIPPPLLCLSPGLPTHNVLCPVSVCEPTQYITVPQAAITHTHIHSKNIEEKRKACMNAHLQQTHTVAQLYITNSARLSSLESLQHFSSVSSNPPSLTAPTITAFLTPFPTPP